METGCVRASVFVSVNGVVSVSVNKICMCMTVRLCVRAREYVMCRVGKMTNEAKLYVWWLMRTDDEIK